MERIGVFVCHCGTNIAGTVDVAKVAEELGKVNGVVYSTHYTYMCSSAGQKMIEDKIHELNLTGVVLCSCSPRMHEKTFRSCAERAGLNAYKVEVANIREQCSWVMKEMGDATEKAIALGKAAVAKTILDTPLIEGETPMTKRALVIGGGIAGITAALDIADAGFPVDIVEKDYTVGGKMAKLDKTFPTLDCASCIVTPKMTEVSQNPNIRILSYSEVAGVKGYIGNFEVDIKRHPRYVDETKCTGCGACIEKCPNKKVPNAFNLNLNNRKAIDIPFAQAVPKVAAISADYCLHMKGLKNGKDNVCGFCEKACAAGAINFHQEETMLTEKYGAIIVATGYNPISLEKFDEYAYSQSPDVVSSLEFERLCNASGPTNGHLLRPSDGKEPKNIVFVQCVGSRCSADSTKGHEYCSKICCMYTAKHAILTRDHYPDTNITVFYIDVRTPGKNFDEFYRRAVEQYGVHYIKGQVGKVTPLSDGTLDVQGSDLILNRQVHIKADMVVLAASIEADKSARPLATMLTTSMDNNDFFLEAHAKLRPVESPTAGIFLAGCCQGPKDIPETVAQSSGAAAKAICLLVKDKLKNNPCTANPNENACNGCGQCANVCPYGAISYIEKDFRGPNRTTITRRVSQVNKAMCHGCGACTVACPSGAMDLLGFSNKQILAEVDSVL
ncbi:MULTISPECIES: CoB--CoM heterodisulfide reductase iron-sulfur subunit A family protein [Treponema]|uniref:Fumarate reductase/succinate dehydrogenase flavoprotein domain protein n=1 Tax=Treponema succinifaciens (strain ATCC 33096 / DSM 2489 / 6091) TaxID=869209 RepID=F2NRY8_TRES6|nr:MULTISPECIES: CoB--CoM heterodisulfide reductase iron-sulfur subunit A family protein [Treponema]AEB14224.1 fumarate reductase/succinate dehydrogenase flavoprotein domain protein [Treponema succinifaciens DSM 2489]MCI6912239.1 CoB--CoM heterodisulfide reductase iron-sulfur subunit A family protein [Treponema succinifaciens]MDD6963169.1 CoB--CoM heterodisulfide reductase iron-sulfur subunit A family protein [Treponema succinifaciens]MDY5117931.1 CoB--CoM heterodisulfide reductase iron-sulfur 